MLLGLDGLIGRYIYDLQLLLKGVRVRNGMALLEPSNVELKGWQNEDMQANQDQEFVRNLRRRMGFGIYTSISYFLPDICLCVSRKPDIDPSEEHKKQAAESPIRAITPPPAALQPYPASRRSPTQAPQPQRAPSAVPESRHETHELTASPHFVRQAPPAVALPPLSPCLPRCTKPPTSGEDEAYSESQSFGGMDMDDDFWGVLDQIEDAERTGGSGRPSTSPSPRGSRTVVSDRSNAATCEVITLDDDEESDEPGDWILGYGGNKESVSVHRFAPPPVQSSQPRPRPEPPSQVQEVIDLSD